MTSKELKTKFIVLLLQQIEDNGDDRREICRSIKKSSANLGYYLKKLMNAELVKRMQSYPYSIYRLTELGRKVKENLAQSEGARSFWRVHALTVGFPIENYGGFKFDSGKLKQMNNWHYQEDVVRDGNRREWRMRVQSTGLLVVSCPEMITEEPNTAFGNMYDIGARLARVFSESHGMRIGRMKIVREGHKELIGSERLAGLFGRMKIEDVWVDRSNGTDRLEEKQSGNSVERLLEVPKLMEFIIEQQADFAKNLKLHLLVLQEIRDAVRGLRK